MKVPICDPERRRPHAVSTDRLAWEFGSRRVGFEREEVSGRRVELDGLRGAAALLVVLAHYFGETAHGLTVLTWGWIGVDVFFVLSGFLVGGIILDQRDEPGFVGRFYLRRAARILPAYLLALASVFAMTSIFSGQAWADHPLGWSIYLSFNQNNAIALWGGGGHWLLPTWTVAVEEQFYLLIPVLILTAPRRILPLVLAGLWLGAVAFRMAMAPKGGFAALTLLPSRADLLLSGVLAAVLDRRLDLRRYLWALRIIPLVAVMGLLGISLADKGLGFVIASPMLMGVGAAAFILSLVHGAPEAARFRAPWLGGFGRISYGLYLFHQPVAGLLHGLVLGARPDTGSPATVAVSVLALAVSIGLAWLSWTLVEGPILALSSRVGRPTTRPASLEVAPV